MTLQQEASKNIVALRPVEIPQHTIILPEKKDSSHGHQHQNRSSVMETTSNKMTKEDKNTNSTNTKMSLTLSK
jgi:hypothetical protein